MNTHHQNQSFFVEYEPETNKVKLLWWRIQEKVEGWYYVAQDFIRYIRQYKP